MLTGRNPGMWGQFSRGLNSGMQDFENRTGIPKEQQANVAALIADFATQNYAGMATDVVSMYGTATGNERLSDYADAAGAAMSVGGAVKGALKEAGKEATKEALKQAAKEAAKKYTPELAKTTVKAAGTQVGKEAVKTAGTEAVKVAGTEAVKTAGSQFGKEAGKEAVMSTMPQAASSFSGAPMSTMNQFGDSGPLVNTMRDLYGENYASKMAVSRPAGLDNALQPVSVAAPEKIKGGMSLKDAYTKAKPYGEYAATGYEAYAGYQQQQQQQGQQAMQEMMQRIRSGAQQPWQPGQGTVASQIASGWRY